MNKNIPFYTSIIWIISFTTIYHLVLDFNRSLPIPIYYPVLHQWSFDIIQEAIMQKWYGMFGISLICSMIITFISKSVIERINKKNTVSGKSILLLTAITVSIVLFSLIAIIYKEFAHWQVIDLVEKF